MFRLIFQGARTGAWLHAQRARAWCIVLATMVLAALMLFVATSHGGVDGFGKPLGTDFISFWSASRFVLSGHAASAYDPLALQAAELGLFPNATPAYTGFFYPPPFLLLCAPLAALPYFAALAVWLGGGLALLTTGLRRLLPHAWAILPIISLPASLINIGHGQNGFVTAACLTWSMVLSRRRPVLAGACLGLLVMKPQLILAAPVVLLAARRWRMIAGALCSALALCGLSWLVLGSDAWAGFLRVSPIAMAALEQGLVPPGKFQTLFAAARLLGGGVGLAYALQAALAVAVCCFVAWVGRRRPGPRAESAVLIAGTLLCTPFLYDYDLVCLAPAMAWVAAQSQVTGWRPWEKTVLLAAYILPLVARLCAMHLDLPLSPAVMLCLLLVVARRASAGADGGF